MNRYQVFFNLTRLEIQLWDLVDKALREQCEIPLGRFEAMLVLDKMGPCRIQEISEQLVITVGGASKLIDRVEASGYCVRTPNPDDRRSSLVSLTPEAQPVIEHAMSVIERTLQDVFDEEFTATQLQAFGQQLLDLRQRASAASAASAESPQSS